MRLTNKSVSLAVKTFTELKIRGVLRFRELSSNAFKSLEEILLL